MPLPSAPNQISARQIKNEFGQKSGSNWKIGDYRRTVTKGGINWPVDEGIPTSGTISFSDFHGKQHNIVIVLNGGQTSRDKILNDKNSIDSTAFRGTSSSIRRTSKNIVYVNRRIGSAKGSRHKCALRTGTQSNWYGGSPNGGKILIRIGSSGGLYGAGGDGGKGGTEETNGDNGENGTSALGLEVNVESITIDNGGCIHAGAGGGGGGGGSREDSATVRRAGGGGGGGGAGLPAGERGGRRKKDRQSEGGKGSDGTLTSGGDGGHGGDNDEECFGGGGGGGGSVSGNAGSGGEGGKSSLDGNSGNGTNGKGGSGEGGDDSGSDGAGESEGGNGGQGGYAITRNSGISSPTLLGETSEIRGYTGQHGVI